MKNYLKEAGNIHLSYYIEAADDLDIKYEIIVKGLLAKFTYQNKHWYIANTVTPLINSPSKTIACRKHLTNLILNKAGISVPKQTELVNVDDAITFFEENKDIVIKPKQGLGGAGISIKPQDINEIEIAYNNAYREDRSHGKKKVLAEEYVSGENYRLLTLGETVIGVVKRNKPFVTGDGQKPIFQLIEEQNPKIPIDDESKKNLKKQNLSLNSIPSKNKKIILRSNTNLTQGATTEEYSSYMHPYYEEIAVKVLHHLNLKFGGIDLIVEDITKPSKYFVNEVNYNPGLKIHYKVHKGEKVRVAIPIMKYIRDNHT